jgi:hypothetical protein
VYFTSPPSLLAQTPPNLAFSLYVRYLRVLGLKKVKKVNISLKMLSF